MSEFYRHQRDKTRYRSACKFCMRRKQRAVDEGRRTKEYVALRRAERFAKMVKLIECPPDPGLGLPLYPPGAMFERDDFDESLRFGYWPCGSVWSFVCKENTPPALWKVQGDTLYEVGGNRVFRQTAVAADD